MSEYWNPENDHKTSDQCRMYNCFEPRSEVCFFCSNHHHDDATNHARIFLTDDQKQERGKRARESWRAKHPDYWVKYRLRHKK